MLMASKTTYNLVLNEPTTSHFWLSPRYQSLLLEKKSRHSINKPNSFKLLFCTCYSICLVSSPHLVLKFPCFVLFFLFTILTLVVVHDEKYFYMWVPQGKKTILFHSHILSIQQNVRPKQLIDADGTEEQMMHAFLDVLVFAFV